MMAIPAGYAMAEDWKARWIYSAGCGANEKNSYILLRTLVYLDKIPQTFPIGVCADALYKLYVNGIYQGRGPAKSIFADKYYDIYDIAGSLQEGANAVCAVVYTYGADVTVYDALPLRGGFILQSLQGDSLQTDGRWRAMPSSAWRTDTMPVSHCRAFVEYYDARKAPDGWLFKGYDDTSWEQAAEISPATGGIWPSMRPRSIPQARDRLLLPEKVILCGSPVWQADPAGPDEEYGIGRMLRCERTGPLKGATVENAPALTTGGDCLLKPAAGPADISIMLDFGREVSGFPFMELETPPGMEIDFGWAEALDKCGHLVLLHSGRLLGYGGRYITSGEPGERWEFFHAAAFRYMQIVFRSVDAPITIKAAGIRHSTYPAIRYGSFTSSDDRLNMIMDISLRTLELGMDDSYMDCPSRERAQWLADAIVQFYAGYPVFGDLRLPRKMLLDFMESQGEDGRILSVFPSTSVHDKWIPGFACLLAHGYRHYLDVSGDGSLDAPFLDCMDRLIAFFKGCLRDGLVTDVKGWLFFDWQPLLNIGPQSALLNLFFFLLLKESAAVARQSGQNARGQEWLRLADEVRQTLLLRFWDEERGFLSDNPGTDEFSQHSNAFALYAGIFDEKRRQRVLQGLIAPDNGLLPVRTPYFKFWVMEALLDAGCHQLVLDGIRREWWPMIAAGATTTWETDKKELSLCHGWSAGPAYWFISRILGVRPLAGGFRKVLIQPFLGDLQWASGSACTALGMVTVHAESRTEGGARVCVALPPGMEGLLDRSLLGLAGEEPVSFRGSLDL